MTYNKLTKHVKLEKVTDNKEKDNRNRRRDNPYIGINIKELKVTMLQVLKKIQKTQQMKTRDVGQKFCKNWDLVPFTVECLRSRTVSEERVLTHSCWVSWMRE